LPCSSDDSPSAPRDPHVPAEADVPAGRWCGGGQAGNDMEDVIGAQTSRFKYKLHRHQHWFETGDGHSSQYLHHDSITVGVTPPSAFEKL